MKPLRVYPLLLILFSACPAMADTHLHPAAFGNCALSGPVTDPSEGCQSLRAAYQEEVRTCLSTMAAEASVTPNRNGAQASRSRLLVCALEARNRINRSGAVVD